MYEAKKTGNQPKLKNFNLNFNFDLQHIHSMQPFTKANMLLFTSTKYIDKKIPLFCTAASPRDNGGGGYSHICAI